MEHFKVLIIGAGVSGIAAASRLLEKGFKDFRILEAENRIGGRVNTVNIGDECIELGAEWIHGEKHNIVYELASKNDLADNSPPKFKFENTNFFELNGCQVNKDISQALTSTFYDIMNINVEDLNDEFLKGSVGNYFEIKFQERLNELKKKKNLDDTLCKKFQKVFENWENSIDASHSWYETSLSGHLDYWECDGNSLTVWKNNRYDTIFSLLTKKIPNPTEQLPVESKIIFNKDVIKIKWNKDCQKCIPNVEVECLDGTIYHADHILVTSSLGVLKERSLEMFCPTLPEKKLQCIKNLGFGTVNKIFLKYSHRWWKEDLNGFAFLWSEEERKNDFSGWLNGVICFHPINSTSSILRGWITGKSAQHMELLSNYELLQGFNYLFDKFLGSQFQIPPVEFCLTSKWYSNPHFKGSYSCRLMQSESSNVWASQLAEPVCNVTGKPVLLFGGEATHDHYFSTVHGAIESGQREAERLLSIFKSESKTKNKYLVAIVGAGISGLAAAKELFQNGISDVIILEAQSEPGGRIRSLQFEDFYLELGAQWIHGDKNEVFNLCQENDLLTDEYSGEGEGLYLRENGDEIDKEIILEVDNVVKDILENCESYILCKSKTKIPHSIGEELLIKFNEYLETCNQDTDTIKTIKKELFGWHIRYQLIDNSCSDLFNLSARAWGHFKFCGGNDYINFKNGYSSLINTLINFLPESMVCYKTSVQCISWDEKVNNHKNVSDFTDNSNYCAEIICQNGFTCLSQYVIVTSSLGYLKKNYKSMFYPPLPKSISEAIEFLDFGVINKIFLIYKKPWWDIKIKGFQIVWSEKEFGKCERHWGRYLTGFDVIIKNKPVLLGWVGGEGAKIVEELSENQVGREATEILRYFTKRPEIPLPEKVIRTQWWCNEYVRGAYSHITVKCDESDISGLNLAQPVHSTVYEIDKTLKKPTILFAGESTHPNYFSTVHGAYESGISQAQLILKYIESQNN